MIPPKGPAGAPVVIVGDAPSYEEVVERQAFHGRVGNVVMDVVRESGFKPNEVVFVNAVSFMKKHGVVLTEERIKADASENLIPFIEKFDRKVIIALGKNAAFAVGALNKLNDSYTIRGSRVDSHSLGIPVVPSINPYFILKTPDDIMDFVVDFRLAHRIYDGTYAQQEPIFIRDIEKVSDVELLYNNTVNGNEYLAYDFETTDKNRDRAKVVTLSFANGETLPTGEKVAWFWGGFDQLQPRFEQHKLDEFKDAFDWVWQRAGKDYALIGFNSGYDDWIAERYVGHELPGSQFDVMLMKWSVNNKRPHGLKETTAAYLGYPDYEAGAHGYIDEIAKRRRRILTEQIDLDILKWLGMEPEISKSGKPKWPKGLDAKLYAYALVPYDILRLYNAYDSVYTRMLFDVLSEIIEEENLAESANLRHKIAKELMRSEQRGFLMDQRVNREFSETLAKIEEECELKIQNAAYEINPSREQDFNPRSNDQLAQLLFGDPVELPHINREPYYELYSKESIDERFEAIELDFYRDYSDVLEAVNLSSFDYEATAAALVDTFKSKYPKLMKQQPPRVVAQNHYIRGIYQPDPEKGFTKAGKPSVAGALLQSYYEENPHDILALVLMQRKANKLRGTFVDAIYKKLDESGVLHGRLNVIGTETGRISSSDPNCQNFPKFMRGQLIPRPGYVFVEGDLSAAEVRAIAAMSGDEKLIAAVNSKDIHRATASDIFKKPPEEIDENTERKYAKTILFGIIYGMSKYRLATAIHVSVDDAERFIEEFFLSYPKLKAWIDNQVELAGTYPYYVYTPWGTRRSTRNILSIDRKTKTHTERIAANMPVQGAAGELTLYYITEIMAEVRKRGWDVHLVNTTHDSITLEVPEAMAWKVQVGEKDVEVGKDDGGNPIMEKQPIMDPAGPVVDLVRQVVATPAPVPPLDQITFKIDMEINHYWSKKPDLMKAIDPNFGTEKSTVAWHLIKPEETLSIDEQKELDELEEAMKSRRGEE